MQPQRPYSATFSYEMMESEPLGNYRGGVTENDNQHEQMSNDIPEQKLYCDQATAQNMSAGHSRLETTAVEMHRLSRSNDLQSTSTNLISVDDRSNKRSSSTGSTRITAHRLPPGDSTQLWQQDQNRHTQISASRQAHRSATAPYQQVKREANELQEIRTHVQSLESTVGKLTKDLKRANDEVAALRKAVTENEAIITRVHATAISTLAGNVSRGLTDDMIREELNKFLQTDVLSWCADFCTEMVLDEDAALHKFLQVGIINKSESYLKGPEYLKFTVNTPDGSGPFVLLRATLVHRLCCLYLSDAYFLAEELHTQYNNRSNLRQLERHFGETQSNAAIDWRIQTVECLERSAMMNEYSQRQVQIFLKEHEFLLSAEKFDQDAKQELVQIFASCASLALKLWKTRTNIKWHGLNGFEELYFKPGNSWVEVEQSLVSRVGRRLNGRPIGLFIHPMITSQLPSKNGKVEAVVWLKALAWVSDKDEPMDQEETVQADGYRV